MRPQNMDVKYERCNYGNSTLLGMWPGIRTDVRHVTSFFFYITGLTKFSKGMELLWRSFGAQETEALVEHFESNSWEVRRSPWAWLQFFYYSEVPILKRLNVTSQKLK